MYEHVNVCEFVCMCMCMCICNMYMCMYVRMYMYSSDQGIQQNGLGTLGRCLLSSLAGLCFVCYLL